MSAEENKALSRRVMTELFNEGNLDVADELLAPDYVDHDPASPQEMRGPEGFKRFVATMRSAFPDTHVRIEDEVAEGDLVATRCGRPPAPRRGSWKGSLPRATGRRSRG